MGLWDAAPKLNTNKKLIVSNGSINAIWYLLHLPLLAYAVIIFALQKTHTVIIDNSPVLLINVNMTTLAPFLEADPSPEIAQYCALAGGPFPCNSSAEVYNVSILNADILQKIPSLQLSKACTRACPIWNELTCFAPPESIKQDGSSSIELISRAAFNTGAISSPQNNLIWILLNHLIGWAPLHFTYSFQLNRAPPFFFGLDPDSGDRKSNKDAHSIAVSASGAVLYSFGPGEEVTITPQGLLVMAGWEWNLTTLFSGGEFAIALNCYNDAHDLPTLDWTNHTQFIPSTQTPLCLLTVEALRMSSINKQTNLASGTTSVDTILRFDTRKGDSFFRLPSFADLVLSLIQCIILLSVPTSLSIMFATTCLGSLSQIFKRTQIEMFFIGSKIPSMGLRLAKDAMALGQVSPEKEQIEIDALRAEMERILADLVSHSKLSELSQDMSDHILKHNQKNKKASCDEHEHECDPCNLANLLSVGERAKVRDVVAYFDHSRRRGLFELAVLPNSHRKDLKRWKKESADAAARTSRQSRQSVGKNSQRPSAFVRMSSRISTMAGLQLETQNDEESMEDMEDMEEESPPEYTDAEKLERAKEDATLALEELKGDVKWMIDLNMQKKESNSLEKVQEKEKRLENRKADVRNLSQKLAVAKELLNAKAASVKSHQKDLMQALEKKERLERCFIDAVKRGKKLRFELHAFRKRMSTDPVCPLPDPDEDSNGQWMLEL